MSIEARKLIEVKAKETKYWATSPREVIASICGKAGMDGVGVDEPLILNYPLLPQIIAACGLPVSIDSKIIYVSIDKHILEDPEEARATFGEILGENVQELFPDWKGEDLFTEINLLSAPLGKIYVDVEPSIALTIMFRSDGRLGSAKAYSTPQPINLGPYNEFKAQTAIPPNDLIIDALRIIAHQLDQKERSPRLPKVTR